MKRIIALAFVAIAALGILAGCKAKELTPAIDISTPSASAAAKDKTITIRFVSNIDWTATSSAPWCKLSSTSSPGQAGENELKITLDPNPDYEPRTATVTIKAEGLEKNVTVTQEAAAGLIVDGATYEVAVEGDRLSIPVQANVDYTVTPDADWITVVQSKALQDYTIVLDVAGNTTGEERSATVTVAGGGLTKTFTVKQAACEHIVVNYIWNSQDDTQITTPYIRTHYRGGFDNKASSYTAYVSVDFANPDLVVVPEEDAEGWIYQVYEMYYDEWSKSYSVSLYVASNSGHEPRTGHFRIESRDGQYKSTEITVEQKALPEHAVDMGTYVFWHEFNLGASAPEGYGDYYAWGELEPKTTYTWSNYRWAGENKYNTIEYYSGGGYSYKSSLDYDDDAASQKLGYRGWTDVESDAAWHLPSQWDFKELLETRAHPDTHKWEWKTKGGHGGWEITYLVTGNSIFLPAAGYIYDGSDVLGAGTLGLYWSSDNMMPNNRNTAYYLRFESGQDGEVALYDDGQRAAGKSIRPVTY